MNCKKYVIGNWKQNPATALEVQNLTHALRQTLDNNLSCTIGVCPSFVHLTQVVQHLGDNVQIGVQDVCQLGEGTGAFTGDVSAVQVADLGAKFALIGHSERRQYHGETNTHLAQKILNAHKAGLFVVLCVGESLDEYQAGLAQNVLDNQLSVLHQIDKTHISPDWLIIAYEPVWAIGTGLTPTTDEITGIHQHIKTYLGQQFNANISVLYGGSVNDKNAPAFAQSPVIDGALVGGASLKADAFGAIVRAFG